MIKIPLNKKAELVGAASGCPFCLAQKRKFPSIGDKVRILTGRRAGRIGMVVPIPQGISLRPLDIALQMNDDSLSIQEIVSLQWDLVEPVPGSPVPSWSPPISLKDAGELDSVVVEFCEKSTSLQSFNWPTFYEFIRLVWKKRLPLTSNEIWLLFEAHGASFKFKKFVVDFYQKGTELLIYVAGRKPIKKKRVQPLLAEN